MIYGLPYQGSKNKLAEDIIFALPPARRFVDLFGGGGAIIHRAFLSRKYDAFLYNDISPLTVEYFRRAVSEPPISPRSVNFISREAFFRLRDKNGFVRFMWSFGSNGEDYAFSPENERIARHAFYHYPNGGRSEIHLRLKRFNNFPRFPCVISNISYFDYVYREGDLVYCDIPYENTGKDCTVYGGKFNTAEFYKWARTRPFPVFFSSYDISAKDFPILFEKRIISTLSRYNNCEKIERLYANAAGADIGINKQLTFWG